MTERKIELLRAAVAPRPPDSDSDEAQAAPTPNSLGIEGSAALWREVLAHLEDDAYHQAFIHACLMEGRMRFALEHYRTLEKMRPDDLVASHYVAQVAKMMAVGAMGANDARERELKARLLSRPMRTLIGLLLALGGILVIYMTVQLAKAALGP